ncbi:hypothetical protein T440DRAFT_469781 [Plenodomus tracheiphilus IPT5]|uniref:Uncharacterized protein n=1 Tax=Plenodomus tracheiphilus IPT5 TaxID=1408161 RepID=A0A6A7B0J9_9PLEO|nr:hypothetical protein T440DRAFT_469781 [Plenodomus tracheiphilus IPT5]
MCWSIVSPAEKAGVIGFKPMRDSFFSEGSIHASKRQDAVRLVTRSVLDAVFVATGINWKQHITVKIRNFF